MQTRKISASLLLLAAAVLIGCATAQEERQPAPQTANGAVVALPFIGCHHYRANKAVHLVYQNKIARCWAYRYGNSGCYGRCPSSHALHVQYGRSRSCRCCRGIEQTYNIKRWCLVRIGVVWKWFILPYSYKTVEKCDCRVCGLNFVNPGAITQRVAATPEIRAERQRMCSENAPRNARSSCNRDEKMEETNEESILQETVSEEATERPMRG